MKTSDAVFINPETNANDSGKPKLFKMPEQLNSVIEKINSDAKKSCDELELRINSLPKEDFKTVKILKAEIKSIKKSAREKQKNIKAAAELDPLKFFCPNGAQEEMINETVKGLRRSTTPVVLMTCGNGVGKTTYAVETISNIIFGPQNGWYDYDVFRHWDKPKLCWYISTAPAIAETVTPMIEELWSKEFITKREYTSFKDKKNFISRIETNNGWTIIFKTYDQDPAKFESAQVGIIVMDEPAPEAIWKAVKSRRRQGCLTLLPMTPLFTPPYIADEIKKNVEAGNPGYGLIESSVYQASTDPKQGGVRGHLNPKTITEMYNSYDEDERDARIYGKLMYFSGLIYPEYNPDIHFVNPVDFPIRNEYTIFQIVDPHDSRPCACLYAAIAFNGRIIIFDETPNDKKGREAKKEYWQYNKDLTLEEEVSNWKEIEKNHRFTKIDLRIMDKRFGWQQRGKKTFSQLFSALGYNFSPSYDAPTGEGELSYGHHEVKRKLTTILEDGHPALVVWNTCRHTHAGFTHYIRRRMMGRAGEDRASSDGVIVEKYKDFMDLVRYLVVAAITPVQRRGKSTAEILLDKIMKNQYLNTKVGSRYDDL